MFIVTFYSYKGGVGRTMALANTAASLARRGKKVLCVDFDLEAPSLPSYGCFQNRPESDGVVDFISQYRKTGIAPDASSYITKCETSGQTVWLMPAGNTSSSTYSEKLASIEWNTLYRDEMGYLLFEDLKQQWASYENSGFDYVLVDSRTGHTDVGGICTRQLPDLVVVMFSPTEQNISGLQPIVQEIRKETTRKKNPIFLRFCASNVPVLDDESGILSEILSNASTKLRFQKSDLLRVHHYSSLAILSHSIFVTDRPNSKLAKEYENLASEIASCNKEDAEGAKTALRKLLKKISSNRHGLKIRAREEALQEASTLLLQHRHDPDVAYLVAGVRNVAGDIPGEIEALTAMLEAGDARSTVYIMRARALRALNQLPQSESDLRSVLADSSASSSDLSAALRMLEGIGVDIKPEVSDILSRDTVSLDVLGGIPQSGLQRRSDVERYAEKLFSIYQEQLASKQELGLSPNNLVLSLIGTRRYADAIKVILDQYDGGNVESMDIADAFNLFVANWGLEGLPLHSKTMRTHFSHDDSEGSEGANLLQCRGLWHASERRNDLAIDCFKKSSRAVVSEGGAFSCLSYLYRDKGEFTSENADAVSILEREEILMPFFFREA